MKAALYVNGFTITVVPVDVTDQYESTNGADDSLFYVCSGLHLFVYRQCIQLRISR